MAYVAPSTPVGISLGRHALSALVAIVAVPVCYISLDLAIARGVGAAVATQENEPPAGSAVAALVLAVMMLFVAVLAGRVSGFGPLLAGVVWGVAPAIAAIVTPVSMARFVTHYSTFYDQAGFGLGSSGIIVFPLVAAALLGAAAAGRWQG